MVCRTAKDDSPAGTSCPSRRRADPSDQPAAAAIRAAVAASTASTEIPIMTTDGNATVTETWVFRQLPRPTPSGRKVVLLVGVALLAPRIGDVVVAALLPET